AGQVSGPIKTRFGWHIIKLLDKKPLPGLDEMRPEIEKKIAKDSRSATKKNVALARLKERHDFELNRANQQLAFSAIDSALLSGSWTFDTTSEAYDHTLFTIKGKGYSCRDFLAYVQGGQKRKKKTSLGDYIGYL